MKRIIILLLLFSCTYDEFVTEPADFNLEITSPFPDELFRINDPIPFELNLTGFAFNKSRIIAKKPAPKTEIGMPKISE